MSKPQETEEREDGGNEEDKKEMWRYEDYKGNVEYFEKPREPDIVDLIDNEKWGSDEEELLPPEEEEEEEDESDDDKELAKQLGLLQTDGSEEQRELTEEEILDLARRQDKLLAERERRRKLKRVKKKEEVLKKRIQSEYHATWNFPLDREGWTEEDLGEEWVEPPIGAEGSGYDPDLVPLPPDEEFDKVVAEQKKQKKKSAKEWKKYLENLKAERMKMMENPPEKYDPKLFEHRKKREIPKDKDGYPLRPYYVPYYKPYPMIPKVHPEVENAWDVVEELEKIEEFLQWASYIFQDGSSYEGTVWDDLAHGKGVYKSWDGLVQYEGMWLQNMMEGHGVLQVSVPIYQPPPDSKLEKEMRAQGWIMKADYMDPEDREWLKKDIEDTLAKPDVTMKESELFENDPVWIDLYGSLPERGRYKYSGQWKHSRMHGCGVLDVNTRLIYGKFYFGELLPELQECTLEACAAHSGLAQVAAAKARMFTKKPDGMVREMEGPFTDPQHPYIYEEEDLWMAPGWINEFYKVPDPWKAYVEEVDKEQEMWLNSFIKSPLRIPGPSELEYLWENGDEFLVLANEPSIYGWMDEDNILKSHPNFQGEILYHVPTGDLINWFYDEKGNIKFFRQPYKEDGSINPEEAEILPDGWDEFFSDEQQIEKEEKNLTREERGKKYKEEEELAERERQKRNEEDERKWREEKEALEEELKLRAQVEIEGIQADLREIAAKFKPRKQKKPPQTQEKYVEEPAKPPEKYETEDAEVPEVVKDEEEEEVKPPSFGKVAKDEEEEDEEDDDKKPRSFGKVAMSEEGATSSKRFPTAFAAITLAPWLRPFAQVPKADQVDNIHKVLETPIFPPQSVKVSCGTRSFVQLRARTNRNSCRESERMRITPNHKKPWKKRLLDKRAYNDVDLIFSMAVPIN